MIKLHDCAVLITGGASGLGKQMARLFCEAGAKVILWDINESELLNTKYTFREQGMTIETAVCDITNNNRVQELAKKLLDEYGSLDILVNNAGVVSGMPFWEIPEDKLRDTLRVNIEAVFWVTRAFLPSMLRQNRGHIVTISSAAGLIGTPALSDYSAAKSAAFGFDESLRMEFRKYRIDIKTTVVCPYFINTGMFAGVQTRFPWLLPILKEETVAQKVVQAVRKNKKRLLIPKIVYIIWILRYLPVSWFDGLASLLGLNNTMDRFTGRKKESREKAEV